MIMKKKKGAKKKRGRKKCFVLIILATLLIGIFIGSLIHLRIERYKYVVGDSEEGEEVETGEIPSLSTEGFVSCNISVSPTLIHLTAECLQLDMTTNQEQTSSIEAGLQKQPAARPWTHDLIAQILDNFGINVLLVKVHTLEEETGTYYAKIFLQKGNKILALDSKPSDAVAIAVRANAKIYVQEELLNKYGKKIC